MAEEKKGFVFETDDGNVDVDIEKIKKMADEGNMDGLYALGMAYVFGWDVDPDPETGYRLLEKACAQGHVDAMALLVRMYFSGDYNMDSKRAVEYCMKASEAGLSDGELYMGIAYMDGVEVEQDYAKAADLFRRSAKQGNAEARNSLAYLYQQGLGVEKDEEKAFKLYKNAASAGCVNAQYQTGICYEMGVGCEKNRTKAAEWYTKAAKEGDPFSMDRMGVLYYGSSPDMPQNPKKSFDWFLMAAMEGLPDSMYTVACYYLDGFGCDKSKEEAVKWLNFAKENNHQSSIELMKKLEEENE